MSFNKYLQKLNEASISLWITEAYLEEHWFNCNSTNALMAKYWAAKEMAESSYWDIREGDGNYYRGNYYFSHDKFINILSQILKKEWFR
jgi:hypothetical protein